MPLIPIGTDVRNRRIPIANIALIALNVLIFLFTDYFGGERGQELKDRFTLDAARPMMFEYLSYQFLHGDFWHLTGNMLFLWIFGNAVCERMGSLPYTLFYLAGGVFAGVSYAQYADNPILGASGAIASVTTAFLVLYPRVQITMLFWMFIVFTFQIPAVVLIVFKIILWDNILSPRIAEDAGHFSNVAHSAHLGGYLFGFLIALLLLAVRALPRNQFDLLALWTRWTRRTGIAAPAMIGGRAQMARPVRVQQVASRPLETLPITPQEELREEVAAMLSRGDLSGAAETYLRLIQLDPNQVLPERLQRDLANYLARMQRYAEAAHAYESFLNTYPAAPDTYQVRLLLGLIYRRHLASPDQAAVRLRQALEGLSDRSQRDLAIEELQAAEAQGAG